MAFRARPPLVTLTLATLFCLAPIAAWSAPLPALSAAGSQILAPLADAIAARSIDPLAFAPLPYEPLASAVAPIDAMQLAQGGHRLGIPGEEEPQGPEPRERPKGGKAAPTETAENPPAGQKPETPELPKPVKGVDTLAGAAQAYLRFKAGVLAIAKLRLSDPINLRNAQKILAGQNQVTLSRGFVAAMGQMAAKLGEFAAGITAAAGGNNDALAAKLEQKPGDAMAIAGAPTASAAIVRQVANDSSVMMSVSERLIKVGHAQPGDEPARAADAAKGNYGGTPITPPAEPSAKAKAVIAQILAIGARMQLSSAGAGPAPEGASNLETDQCLRWANVNLSQCLSVVHDNNERAYCLGLHGISDRVKCWSWLAGAN